MNPSASTSNAGFRFSKTNLRRDINVGWVRRAVCAVTHLSTQGLLPVATLSAVVRKAGYAIKPLTRKPPYGLRALGRELSGVANRLDGEVHIKVRPIQVMRSRTLDV